MGRAPPSTPWSPHLHGGGCGAGGNCPRRGSADSHPPVSRGAALLRAGPPPSSRGTLLHRRAAVALRNAFLNDTAAAVIDRLVHHADVIAPRGRLVPPEEPRPRPAPNPARRPAMTPSKGGRFHPWRRDHFQPSLSPHGGDRARCGQRAASNGYLAAPI